MHRGGQADDVAMRGRQAQSTRHAMNRPATLWIALLASACDGAGQSPPRPSAMSPANPSSSAARADDAARGIAARLHVPAPVMLARQVQDRIGDGVLGPSDRRTYTYLEVPSHRLATWQVGTERLAAPPAYAAPESMSEWVSRGNFDALEFFSSSPLLPQSGWIGLARAEGRIYVFTFTT